MSVEALISLGHAPGDVWSYTPKQIAAFLFIASRRRGQELADELKIARLAAHGSADDLKSTIRRLEA